MSRIIKRSLSAVIACFFALSAGLSASAESGGAADASRSESESSSASDSAESGGKNTDSDESSDEVDPEEELIKTLERENFHRKGKWGYTVLEDGTAAVSDYFGKAAELKVPEKIDGYVVSAIGGGWYADEDGSVVLYGNVHNVTYEEDGTVSESSVYSPFTGNEFIKEVTLPDSVTCIGAISFKDCTELEKITLGDGVEIIGNNCFEGCTSLSEVEFSKSLKYVDQQVFYNCKSLAEIELPDARYETAAFERCTGLESVVLPEGMTSLPPYMFSQCTSLRTVQFFESLKEVGDSAFYKCTALEHIELPDSVTTIHNNAFSGCTALYQALLGANIETLGSRSFADCTSLKELFVGEKASKFGDCAFGMTEAGELIDGFTLVCPDYSPAKLYAEDKGIAFKLVEPSESAASAAAAEIGDEPQSEYSELMFYTIIGLLVLAAAAVMIILILMLKNRNSANDE